MNKRKATEIRVDFSLKREVLFVVIGAMLGAVSMLIPTVFVTRLKSTTEEPPLRSKASDHSSVKV
ncbi:MAG TPA: hypothetical protein VK462_00490 [Nitrososphaeraceae archaeon]|nr:hypothetical protein [Nitrososphaeraceae archaeon]